jgi:hypothetical protein
VYFSKTKYEDKKKTSKYSQYVNKIKYRLNIVFKKLQEQKKSLHFGNDFASREILC